MQYSLLPSLLPLRDVVTHFPRTEGPQHQHQAHCLPPSLVRMDSQELASTKLSPRRHRHLLPSMKQLVQ